MSLRILLYSLLFLGSDCVAQYKQVPDINHERLQVNKQLLKSHHKGYKVIELELFPDKLFDTTQIVDFKYNADGRLQEMLSYTFNRYEEVKDLEYWQKLNRYQQGVRVTFTYDSKGNVVARRSTLISPRNSYMALMYQMINAKNQYAGKYNVDSLLDAGVPEQSTVRELLTTKYNIDNNLIASFDSVDNTTTSYKYVYDKDKRVVEQRITSYKVQTPREKTVSVFKFVYDGSGNLDTITAYRSFFDTINVISGRNRQYMVGRVFNEKAKPISEYTTSQSASPTEATLFYIDTLNTGSIVLNKNAPNDTNAIIQIDYDEKKRAIAERKITFYQGKRYAYNRSEYTYDADDNATEIRYFTRQAEATKDVMEKKTLFIFY